MNCWKNSESHWETLMAADITHIGVGAVYEEDSVYGYYWQVTVIRTNVEFADQYIAGEEETAEITKGDITGDGYVDAYDYIAITNYLFDNNTENVMSSEQLEMADCFRDGLITEADAYLSNSRNTARSCAVFLYKSYSLFNILSLNKPDVLLFGSYIFDGIKVKISMRRLIVAVILRRNLHPVLRIMHEAVNIVRACICCREYAYCIVSRTEKHFLPPVAENIGSKAGV